MINNSINPKKIATVTLTRDSPQKLERLLQSARKNEEISSTLILVVDDSYNHDCRKQNRKIVKKNNSLYIDAAKWEIVKKRLLKIPSLSDIVFGQLINSFVLGKKEWNGYNGRNISMLIIKAYFKYVTHTFHLDDDMIIDPKFTFPKRLVNLAVVQIEGSPDAARREWIVLYILYLYKKYNVKPHINKKFYIQYLLDLMSKLSMGKIRQLITTYTDIKLSTSTKMEFTQIVSPPRDFIAGAYLTSTQNYYYGLFPNCYDEDWSWYNKIKSHNRDQGLIKGGITHEASKKLIFIDKVLQFEDKGSIISYAIRNKNAIKHLSKSVIENYISLTELSLIDHRELAVRLLTVVDENERMQLEEIIGALNKLSEYMRKQSPMDYIQFINDMKESDKTWKSLLRVIDVTSQANLSNFL